MAEDNDNTIISKRKVHIEFLRIFACYMVFYNHTDAAIRNVAADDLTKIKTSGNNFILICKTAVPLFLMIAGANLKRKDDSLHKSIFRIVKTLVMILLVSVFYHIYYYQTFNFAHFMKELISGKTTLAIWYLYLYLGIMIVLPILQHITFPRKIYLYIFFVHLLGPGLVPFVEHYLGMELFSEHLGAADIFICCYLFVGGLLENELEEKHLSFSNFIAMTGLGVCALGISLILAINKMWNNNEMFDCAMYNTTYYTPTILLACSFYFIFQYLGNIVCVDRVRDIIILIGGYTLGIYIMGDFLRTRFEFVSDFLKCHMSELVSVLTFDLFLLIVGIAIMWMWSKLKLIFKVMVYNEKEM